ncbi:MAG TPA: BrnT family toxin [Pyrinomonadaceae bacterium]|nr:BrnT family toxin [Pyrinomonadaceae bacterium]
MQNFAREMARGATRFAANGLPHDAFTSVILGVVSWEWDDEKARVNLEKDGVSFEEAVTVFDDPLYIDFYDPDHSADEHRYLIVGVSETRRLLIVSYTERREAIRLISAREVTAAERKAYEEG